MEATFGYDLSSVRIHRDGLAADLGARAFARGPHLHFAPGAFDPDRPEGRELLGHEIHHAIRQSEGTASEEVASEREADRVGRRVARGERIARGSHDGLRPLHYAERGVVPIERKVEAPPGTGLGEFEKYLTRDGNVYTAEVPDRTKEDVDIELFYSLFSSPRTFRLPGKTDEDVQRSLIRQIRARKGILEFARKKKYVFEGGTADFRMNPKYWWWDASKATFGFKEGVDRQEARDDVNKNPGEYAIGCAAATKITMKGGSRSGLIDGSSSHDKDWVPGDAGYIKNTAWNGVDAGLEGENIIYMGRKLFWGHFTNTLSIRPFSAWFKMVEKWNGSARLESDRQYPDAGLR